MELFWPMAPFSKPYTKLARCRNRYSVREHCSEWPACNGEQRRDCKLTVVTSSVFPSVRPREELVRFEFRFVLWKTIRFLFYCVCKSISRRIQASSPKEFARQRWNRRVFPLVLLASKQRKSSCSVSLWPSARNSSIEILVELPFHEV